MELLLGKMALIVVGAKISLLYLMRAIARAHASTRANSLMRVKIAHTISVYDIHCLGHWNKENKRKNKNVKFNSCSFFFNLCQTFVSLNVVLTVYDFRIRE